MVIICCILGSLALRLSITAGLIYRLGGVIPWPVKNSRAFIRGAMILSGKYEYATTLLSYKLSIDQFQGDYDAASPCKHVDLPQTELEPILTRRAVHKGWTARFSTVLLTFTRPSPDVIISEVRDEVMRKTFKIRSKFLFGCDGARSQVVRELKIPLLKKPGQGLALNVLVKADLSRLVKHRTGNLHWVFSPETEHPPWGWAAVVRMVRPWYEWMFIFLPAPGADVTVDAMTATHDEYMVRIKEMIGDDSIDVEILDASKWWINETVAEYYSDGNVYAVNYSITYCQIAD
jgi:2-polyprenyl-6-methoxyphenol hydroxylase-like FAD-dependent oxidoreductase